MSVLIISDYRLPPIDKPKRKPIVLNGSNTCYECGNPTESDRFFCDTSCRDAFFKRYGEGNAKIKLGQITKWRKKKHLPYHVS